MTVHAALIGISARFSPDEIECLVRTAADVVCGDRADLTSRQLEVAQRAHTAIHGADEHNVAALSSEERLSTLAEDLNLDPLALDDRVHDLVADRATGINNGGLEAQISYLLGELGEADTEQAIRNAANRARQ